MTLLEEWAENGMPEYYFESPSMIGLDMGVILRIVQEHVDIKIKEALREQANSPS
jgi:hypothetical protein